MNLLDCLVVCECMIILALSMDWIHNRYDLPEERAYQKKEMAKGASMDLLAKPRLVKKDSDMSDVGAEEDELGPIQRFTPAFKPGAAKKKDKRIHSENDLGQWLKVSKMTYPQNHLHMKAHFMVCD